MRRNTTRSEKKHPDPHPPFWRAMPRASTASTGESRTWANIPFEGSTANNIISAPMRGENVEGSSLAVFKDDNPNAPADARYKAILLARDPRGLLPFKSPDGFHWSPMSQGAVVTDGAFDSQNLAFWDGMHGVYRAYWRYFTHGVTNAKNWKPKGLRAIRTATSTDFLHWIDHADLQYADSPAEQLYTSQIKPYYRAPQILIGFPTRYLERGWSESMRALPDRENRESRAAANERYGTALSEVLVMSSRDGVNFQRWNEAFHAAGHRAQRHLGLWRPIHRLADVGNKVGAGRGAERTFLLLSRELLAWAGQ